MFANFTDPIDTILKHLRKDPLVWREERGLFDTDKFFKDIQKELKSMKNVSTEKTEHGYIKHIDMPGFDKSEVKVKAVGNEVNIKAETSSKKRTFEHSFEFNAEKEKLVEVALDKGVLSITFELIKKESASAVEFTVK